MTTDNHATTATTERERFVNDLTRYVKTHGDWKNLQPEAAVREAAWVLATDRDAFEHLCSVWDCVDEEVEEPGACASCGHDPACGFASLTQGGVTSWLCHDDDHSCYAPENGSTREGSKP